MNSATKKLIQNTILQRMGTTLSFTSLEIRNDLKAISDTIRYQDVADTVRDMFECYVMEDKGYTRCLVEVETDGGDTVQTFLYQPLSPC